MWDDQQLQTPGGRHGRHKWSQERQGILVPIDVAGAPIVNHLLEFLYATDRRDFDAALSHFEPESVVAAPDLNGGVPMNLSEFRAMIDRWIETSADAPERQHECDNVMMSPDACFVEGFVTSEQMPPRYFMCSAKLGSSGRIRRYSFLSWSVDETTAAAIRTTTSPSLP